MDKEKDVQFLREYRQLIDSYLFLGYAPSEKRSFGNEGIVKMQQALEGKDFQKLRRFINERKAKAHNILEDCGVATAMIQYPPPAIGGPVLHFKLFDLVMENRSLQAIRKNTFLDRIDEAIGVLQTEELDNEKLSRPGIVNDFSKGFIFIAMPMDLDDAGLEDVHEAIKSVASELDLYAERVDDPDSNEPITERILESLRKAEFIVADLTHSKPNVYFEAGYAQGYGTIPIYIARKGTKIEFDLKDYPVVFFENITKLKELLIKRLTGLISSSN